MVTSHERLKLQAIITHAYNFIDKHKKEEDDKKAEEEKEAATSGQLAA